MPVATLTEKGQIVISAEIRARYELTPGTQVELIDEGGTIRLLVRRRVAPSDPAAGLRSGQGQTEPEPATPAIGVPSCGHAQETATQYMIAACERFVSFDDCRFHQRRRCQ